MAEELLSVESFRRLKDAKGGSEPDGMAKLISELSSQCTSIIPKKRPAIREVHSLQINFVIYNTLLPT